jgi:hypothetical protein
VAVGIDLPFGATRRRGQPASGPRDAAYCSVGKRPRRQRGATRRRRGRAGVHHTDDAAGIAAAEVVDVNSREQRNDAAVTAAKDKTAAMAETVLGTSAGRNQDAGTFPVMIDLIWNKVSICCRQV